MARFPFGKKKKPVEADAEDDILDKVLSRKQQVKIAIENSKDDGFDDAEAISLRSGLPQAEIEAAMTEVEDARSPSERLRDSLREIDRALTKAYETYDAKPHQGSANSISVLTRTRRDLIRDLEACRDPTDIVRGLDVRALGPFVRSVITSSTSALSNAIDQAVEQIEKHGKLTGDDKRRLLSNAIRAYGTDIDSAYGKMISALLAELGATAASIDLLESDSAVQQWAKPESRPRRRGNSAKTKKRKGEDDEFDE